MPDLTVAVYANGTLVGHADLQPLDPSLGVYGGAFQPNEGYDAVRPVVLELMRRAWPRQQSTSPPHLREAYRRHDALDIEVRTEAGDVLHPTTVHIEDAGGVWTDEAPQIELRGLPSAEADHHFPTG